MPHGEWLQRYRLIPQIAFITDNLVDSAKHAALVVAESHRFLRRRWLLLLLSVSQNTVYELLLFFVSLSFALFV